VWNIFVGAWVTYWCIKATKVIHKDHMNSEALARLANTAFRQAAENYLLRRQLIDAGIEPVDLPASDHELQASLWKGSRR
jgi:hypothetical protein